MIMNERSKWSATRRLARTIRNRFRTGKKLLRRSRVCSLGKL